MSVFTIAMRWLANPDKSNLSLVKLFEHLYSESVNSDVGSTLVQDVADRVAAVAAPKLGAGPNLSLISKSVPLALDAAGCCMTYILDLRLLALSMISNFDESSLSMEILIWASSRWLKTGIMPTNIIDWWYWKPVSYQFKVVFPCRKFCDLAIITK